MVIKKVLIAIDYGKHAEHAAEYGFELARKFGAETGLVNIVEPVILPSVTTTDPIIGMPTESLGVDERELMDIQQSQSENIVDQTIRKFAADMQVTHFTEYGSTADGIITCAKEFNICHVGVVTHYVPHHQQRTGNFVGSFRQVYRKVKPHPCLDSGINRARAIAAPRGIQASEISTIYIPATCRLACRRYSACDAALDDYSNFGSC